MLNVKRMRVNCARKSAKPCYNSAPMGQLDPAQRRRLCSARYEREARQRGWLRIAGLDEAGRGALFGPVVAAAVILNSRRRIVGLDDSKKLLAERRTELAAKIR